MRGVTAWGNVVGFSGTNMRYVTIAKSRWFNNGVEIVPNALRTEKYPPPEDNVIAGNDIFWNNFNWLAGFAAIPQVELAGDEDPALREASVLRGNVVRGNASASAEAA